MQRRPKPKTKRFWEFAAKKWRGQMTEAQQRAAEIATRAAARQVTLKRRLWISVGVNIVAGIALAALLTWLWLS